MSNQIETMEEKEKELLERLKKAAQKDSLFTITLDVDGEILTERKFSANQFSKEAIAQTHTHFLMNDIIRMILKTFTETEKDYQDKKKKEELEKIWKKKGKV